MSNTGALLPGAIRFIVGAEGIIFEYENGDTELHREYRIGSKCRETYAFCDFVETLYGYEPGSLIRPFAATFLHPGDEIFVPEMQGCDEGYDPTTDYCVHGNLPGECDFCDH